MVLASSSSYFHRMFSSEFGEKDKSRVELHGVESGAMQLVLSWVYTGGSVHISVDNAESLLQAASLLQMSRLTEEGFVSLKMQPISKIQY